MVKLYISILVIIAGIALTLTGCEKENVEEPNPLTVTITTSNVSAISIASAISGGSVNTSGEGSITNRGVCFNIAPSPTIQHNKVSSGSGRGNFTGEINGLQPLTTYFVRAYAIAGNGDIFYGDEKSFSTMAPAPVITLVTSPASGVTDLLATVGGTIGITGSETITQRGVCWSTTPIPLITNNKAEASVAGPESFSANLTGLSAQTKYYARAYVITGSGNTIYGNQIDFTTLAAIPAPSPGNNSITISTNSVSTISANAATSGGVISIQGLETVSSRGVCWSISPNPTTVNSKTVNGSGQGGFQSSLSGLTAGTKYYVRAYAIGSSGTAVYGNQVDFITTAAAPNPSPAPVNSITVTTTAVSEIAANTATTGGSITIVGMETVTGRGVCLSTSPNPTIANIKTVNGSGNGTFQSSLTSLTPSTKYYVRAYAVNSTGITTYGNELSFTTIPTPAPSANVTVTTGAIKILSNSRVSAGGTIISSGSETIKTRGVYYGNSENLNSGIIDITGGSGSFEVLIFNLKPETKYYARAYAITTSGITVLGNIISFTIPRTTGGEVNVISYIDQYKITATTASAHVNIELEPFSTTKITSRGLCFNTSTNPTIQNTKIIDPGSAVPAMLYLNLTNLTPSTTYYARGYAITSDGTVVYSNQFSFTTSDLGTFSVVTRQSDYNAYHINVAGEVTTKDNTISITSRGIFWSTTPSPSTTGTKKLSGSGLGYYTIDMTGLSPNTTYYAQAFATSSTGKTVLGNELPMKTMPLDPPPPAPTPTPTPTPNPTPTPTPTPTPGTGGPDDILLTYLVWARATNDCKEGSALFEDAIAYYTKVINQKDLVAEKAKAEVLLRNQYGSKITALRSESTAFTTNRYAAVIQYNKKHSGWDCRSVIIAFGFGKTKVEALNNAIKKKTDNAGNVPHVLLKELNW